MALQKQRLPIPLDLGLNTKIDDKVKPIGVFNKLENVVYDEIGKIKKRPGYDQISMLQVTDTPISQAQYLAKYKDELLVFNSTNMYARSPTLNRWTDRGLVYKAGVSSLTVYQDTYQQEQVDSHVVEGFSIFAWRRSDGTGLYSVYDRNNKSFLVSAGVLATECNSPRIGALNNEIFFTYANDSGSLLVKKINLSNPASLSTATTIASDVVLTNIKIDCDSSENNVYIAYRSTNGVAVLSMDQTATVFAALAFPGEDPSFSLDLRLDSQTRAVVTYGKSNGQARYLIVAMDFTSTILAPTTINSEATYDPSNVTMVETSSGNYHVYIEWQSTDNIFVQEGSVTDTGTVTIVPASSFIRGVGLASKAVIYQGVRYLFVVYPLEPQTTYFLSDENAKILGKISPGIAGSTVDFGVLTNIRSVDEVTFQYANQVKTQNESEQGTFFSLLGTKTSDITFEPTEPYQNAEMGENLHIASSVLQMYDGSVLVEHGFHVYPEPIEATPTSTGGSMNDGVRQYVAVYSWIDAKGQQHRSAASVPTSVTFSAGNSTQKATITVNTLRITDKENVIVEIYRTEDVGDIFYKVTSTLAPVFNDKMVDTVTFVDTTSDASLISNEVLYTTGEILENIAAPPCTAVTAYNNRLILTGLEDENAIAYSKIRVSGAPVEFNDTLVRLIKNVGGGIQTAAVMDDKVILFKKTAIFFFSGSGPNNLGQQDDFTEPEVIATDLGTIEKNSIVLTPDGIMFKSDKGIYLLSRSLGLDYIGAPVEGFNNLNVSSAKIVAKKNQVRFTTEDGASVVYNYNEKKWSTFENHKALSAEVIGNDYYYIRPDNLLYQQNESFSDDGSPIKIRLETGWISLANVQGFGRIYKVLLLGDFKSNHKVLVKAAYDFNESWVTQEIVDPTDFIDTDAYGEESPYGSGSPYGGDGNVMQIRVDLEIQKCQSIKLSFEDLQENAGEGLSISSLLLVVGVKGSEYKINQDKVYGTEQ